MIAFCKDEGSMYSFIGPQKFVLYSLEARKALESLLEMDETIIKPNFIFSATDTRKTLG